MQTVIVLSPLKYAGRELSEGEEIEMTGSHAKVFSLTGKVRIKDAPDHVTRDMRAGKPSSYKRKAA